MYGNTADHIVSPRNGGAFYDLNNLRWLCKHHDSAVKEDASGRRFNGGKAVVKGCDSGGNPIDPEHPWNTMQK